MPWTHHSHSGEFCRHAKGTLRETVEEAYKQHFELFCLSEHMPRFRQQDLYPEESDLTVGALSDTFNAYIEAATELKQEYAGKQPPLEILIGLETDVIHKNSLAELKTVRKQHAEHLDFIVGSVHHVEETPIDFDKETFDRCLEKTCDGTLKLLFERYFDAQYDLLQSAQPEVIGHFDLCRLYYPNIQFEDYPSVWDRIQRNIDYAISYGALFEINAAAFRKGWHSAYPAPDVLQLIKRKGGKFCLSDDSHGPQAVGLHFSDAKAYLQAQGVTSLYRLTQSSEASPRESKSKVVQIPDNWRQHIYFKTPKT